MNLARTRWVLNYYWHTFLNITVLDRRKLYAAWEYDQVGKLLAYLDIDCIFDIGANEGQYAEMLRRKAGYRGRIVSFEPIPDAAVTLRKKAAKDPLWSVEELAIGEEDGTAEFNVMALSQFSSFSKPRHDEVDFFVGQNDVQHKVTVKTERLATTFARLQAAHSFKRPFLKMDTQGFDYKIAAASPEAVSSFFGLQSELAIRKLYADSVDFRDSITLYEKLGFTMTGFVPNNPGHFPRLLETDCLMIRADLAK